jgi:hypothetical protein
MSQITALGKRPCPDCGGELEWNAAKQVLACPYCGFVPKDQPPRGPSAAAVSPPAATATPSVVELDLERALIEVGAGGRGYRNTDTIKVKCQSCHAISVFEPTRVAQRCDFCGSRET